MLRPIVDFAVDIYNSGGEDVELVTPELDWELSALAGQFQEDDQGLRVESTRYFGPTELTFFAYDTDQSEAHGGFKFYVPLPWFDDGQPVDDWRAILAPDFGYLYRTDSDALGKVPLPSSELDQVRQRLRPEYIEANTAALRRAAWLFLSR